MSAMKCVCQSMVWIPEQHFEGANGKSWPCMCREKCYQGYSRR